MLLMRDIMMVEEINAFTLTPSWYPNTETVFENVMEIELDVQFVDGVCEDVGFVNMNAFESSEEAWEYAKNLVCTLFDDGKLDLVSEAIKGFVLLD